MFRKTGRCCRRSPESTKGKNLIDDTDEDHAAHAQMKSPAKLTASMCDNGSAARRHLYIRKCKN